MDVRWIGLRGWGLNPAVACGGQAGVWHPEYLKTLVSSVCKGVPPAERIGHPSVSRSIIIPVFTSESREFRMIESLQNLLCRDNDAYSHVDRLRL